ncbi:MAG: ATP-binding protein [Acidimicrobiia bacterium]|nr:ATP-binding protein [Acidimicrobiia bacterium]
MIGSVYTLAILLGLLAIALGIALLQVNRARNAFRRRLQSELGSASSSETSILGAATSLQDQVQEGDDRIEQLKSALNASPMGIVIVDDDATEVFSNRTASLYASGRAGDAVVGMRLRELIDEVIATGEEREHQVEVFTPPPRKIQLNVSPMLIGSRRTGALAVAHDVTDRSEVDTIRRDFVANASHELKTPLGALRLLAEALTTTPDRSVQETLSNRIQTEASRMTKLVEDILDLSLIEEHQTVRGVVDLADVIHDAMQKTELAAGTQGIEVIAKCEQVRVVGDPRRLTSAVANLLENAINYTAAKGEEAPAPVEVRVTRSGDLAVIEVEDRGIGIAERHQRRIFERFYRVDRGRSRESGGTGLGLAIARHVVENHWGEIELESTPGRGSVFRIKLPARED